MIPTTFHYHGDVEDGAKYRGLGKKFLADLQRDMGYSNTQASKGRPIHLEDGTVIQAVSSYGVNEVHIYTGDESPPPDPQPECRCGQYFSEGVVTGITPITGYVEAAQLYTVEVCQEGGTQISVDNCVSHDFHVHAVGDSVWCCLDIREVVATPVWHGYFNPQDVPRHYNWAAAWGSMGEYGGWVIKSVGSISWPWCVYDHGCYTEDSYLGGTTSSGALASMCRLSGQIDNGSWSFNSPSYSGAYGLEKDVYSIYNQYTMDHAFTNVATYPPTIEVKHRFNLHIVPEDYLGSIAHEEYTLYIAQPYRLHPDSNMVDVRVISKVNHVLLYNPISSTSELTTDSYFNSFSTVEILDDAGAITTVDFIINNVPVKIKTQMAAFSVELDEFKDSWSTLLDASAFESTDGSAATKAQRDAFTSRPLYVMIAVSNDTDIENSEGRAAIISAWRENKYGISQMKNLFDNYGVLSLSKRILPAKKLILSIYNIDTAAWSFFDIIGDAMLSDTTHSGESIQFYPSTQDATLADGNIYSAEPFMIDEYLRVYNEALQSSKVQTGTYTSTLTTLDGDIYYNVQSGWDYTTHYYYEAPFPLGVYIVVKVTGNSEAPASQSVDEVYVKFPGQAVTTSAALKAELGSKFFSIYMMTAVIGQLADDSFVLTDAI